MAGECGSCTMCCRVYSIPKLEKPAGAWCQHCDIGKGCKIYDTRPETCVEYKCLWLLSQHRDDPREHLAPELRPDRCKVVFGASTQEDLFSATTAPGAPDAWRKPVVRRLIDAMIADGLRVAVGPPQATRTILVTKHGEREVRMTEPDENGMQWSIDE